MLPPFINILRLKRLIETNVIPLLSESSFQGYYCPTQTLAVPCEIGHYCVGTGNTFPLPCYPGSYSPTRGQSNCNLCEVGFQCPGFERSAPEVCQPGFVCDEEGLRYHTSDAQAAMFVVRVPLPTILIACLAFRLALALLGLFVSREWLTTTHPTGCQVLRWAHWLRSLVRKATSVPPILPLPWAVESAYRVTTAQRIPPYPFQHRQGPLPAKKEAPSSEVFVSQAHSHHGQGKSAALRVQREAPV